MITPRHRVCLPEGKKHLPRKPLACSTSARWMANSLLGVLVLLGAPMLSSNVQAAPRVGVQIAGNVARVTLIGSPNTSWTVQVRTGLNATNPWLPLASLTLTNSTATVVDITGPVAGQRFYRAVSQQVPTNVLNPNLVWIAPGSFVIGSPTNEVGHQPDEIQHPVTITKGFFMSKYLVTQGEFQSVAGYNPSYFNTSDPQLPVEQVNWYGAAYYCAQLTQSEQQAKRLPTNWVYRLPTEAEWEYACRAGTTNRFSYGDDPGYTNLANYAWYSANSSSMTQDVGLKLLNPAGLYDMHGDVYEWCQDVYGSYPTSWVIDPQGPASGPETVFRGGGWVYGGQFCRSAGRYSTDPSVGYNSIGFRIVAAPSQ